MPDLQSLRHLGDVNRLALEGEYGGTRHDIERRNLGQVSDDVLGNSIGEILLLGSPLTFTKWQHGNRKLRGQSSFVAHNFGGGHHGVGHAENLHRLRHVLAAVFAEILETELNFAPNVAEDRVGYENGSGLGQGLPPRRDVDAVAVEIATLHHQVAEIDPDAHRDLPVLG